MCLCRTLHGTGQNTRNYLYVEDVARAFDVIFHKGVVGNVYNIGSSNEVANASVARSLLRLMDKCGSGGAPVSSRTVVFLAVFWQFRAVR